tara:strand:- start:1497 stop:2276 length:780 start_codon:yes stop_codon:yes gene_type:complete
MTLKLSHWYGRLGNNIQQCALGTLIAKNIGGTFEQSLDHEIIKKHKTSFGHSTQEISSKFFYYEGPHQEIDLPIYQIRKEIRYICKNFIQPHLQTPRVDVPDDCIVIHVRSGDVFDQRVANPNQYIPAPYDYYRKLLDQFEKAIVVTEPDQHNPIVRELSWSPKVTLQSKSVAEDFGTLMSAKNIASSGVGTFAIAAALCSRNIEKFFCTNLHITEHLNWKMLLGGDIEVNMLDLSDYIKPGEWENTDEQRQFLFSYKI